MATGKFTARHFVAAVVLVFVGLAGALASAAEVWTYDCTNSICVKRLTDDTASAVSLSVCRLLCPNEPGTVWPKIRGSVALQSQQLAVIDGRDIRLQAEAISRHETFWPENEQRFVRQIQRKIPASAASAVGGKALRVRIHVAQPKQCQIWRHGLNESYRIASSEALNDERTVHVTVEADTIFGARHALETLVQLLVFDDIRQQLLLPTDIAVHDEPAFGHRGLLLDTARNFFSVESIKRTIDAMAMVKMNVFHWHITDSQSFPLQLKSHPDLARLGAYDADKIYTADQIADILDYAFVRGVRVLPEFDAPAHVGEGWQQKNLTVCFNQQPWSQFCVEPPCGQLNPTRDELYSVLGDIYAELFELFRSPGMFHMGGDEVSVACWNTSAEIRDWMHTRGWTGLEEADFMRLWGHFQANALQRVDAAVAARQPNRSPLPVIMWTSRLTDVPFVNDYLDASRYIIQIWTTGSDRKVVDLLDRGYRLIMSNYDALYFDCGFGAWVTSGQNWCSPYIGWEKVYMNDWRDIAAAPERRALIVGAEAALWSEQADEHVLDGRFWPRASALAERLWSDPTTSWREAEPRMLLHRERLVQNGLAAERLQPQWCRQNEHNCPI